ncbi:ATP dependent helicase, Lhr family [Micromonospora viridifaciens]|uniref:ATP dependent helicase, Lhr family n=1 Tax=Micromonospora viridifaciens TaxID=1881 RepID=A0A1C4ZE44_MICVI|nr:DEAD/DEAH box helicase [Micromonospora viridifaciens]SCF31253.1 ATP dependent helicase, Lhr family [Micromonospora viridifaciens]
MVGVADEVTGGDAAVLAEFGAATREWFAAAFAAPTAAQTAAWRSIAAGRNALVVAPTGSGKTLAAFLWSLDRLAKEPPPAEARQRCRVLYVSPLKALAVDVERNLRAPLAGIRQAATRLGLTPPEITVGMRTGDTPADERRAFARTPPDILITTPESLFLLLTSAARESLRGVRTVIVDEVHAVAGTKRGAHLALSLERLDALLEAPAQRIGLSATVRPVDGCARFLGGARPVDVVQPASSKTIEVSVQVPVEDMTRLDEQEPPEDDLGGPGPRRASIWPAVEERVFALVRSHRSTIVFTNSRRSAERLCARLNELAAEELAAAVAPDGSRLAQGGGPVGVSDPPGWDDGPAAADGGPRRGPLRAPRQPAEVMAQSGAAAGAAPVIARAHHGSVSREERKHIEEALKSGQLPAVVATSSLELGIDMGAVDLVVQIEAPPSVAAGLQRVGRAGHQVGAVSRGVVFPKHRGDLLSCTVVAERMGEGAIEELHYPRNPLDVLAQQIVAMVALEPWRLGDLAVLVRRAAPFAELPDSALHAVLDMLSGRYPSTAFAELRPRLVWDRATDVLTGRPGAQRLAVTSGGTIPDRGLFGVFLAGAERAARVGELDEEMVYESRVGDVFLLGSSSWRIEEITPDRVLVSPAPGQAARMPFWKGDQLGRPVELGRAIGARVRALLRQGDADAVAALRAGGLDDWAAGNLMAYLREQQQATRALPDDRTVVVERFRDELGDWRLAVHSVLGARVNGPWALAIGRRLAERYGVDAQVMPADDGIVVRLPDTADEPPGADVVVFEPDEIAQLVEVSVGTSALFASRFRECAARSLLLPRRDPRRRQPLWQQRQRAAQLLDVAREYADFPVTLEAARECLQDVFDQPALAELMRDLAARKVRLVEVESERPSPFARSLLFGYVGAFLYEGDAPLAERRAAALALDSGLLGELLGRVDLRELLDPAVLAETERQLRWLTEQRRPRDAEDAVELLRVIGDLSEAELAERGVPVDWLTELAAARRVLRVRIAGEERWVGVEDAARLRDALGVALPVGVAEAYLAPVADPLGDLVARYARTHGPFAAATCAARFGLGVFVVEQALRRLAATGRVVSGEFAPDSVGTQWCDAEVLRLLRRRSLAALRREIEPVPPRALAAFLPRWQQIGSSARGVEAVAATVEQLQGVAVPASALERLVLPARVADYSPAQLDELCASGEVVWAGSGAISGGDGWITLAYADAAPLLLPPPDEALARTPLHDAVLDALADGQALFFRSLSDRVGSIDDAALTAAIWDLVWAGHLTNDTLAPLRAVLGAGGAHRSRPAAPRTRYRRPGRVALPSRGGPPTVAGRWSRLPERDLDPTRRAAALADLLLERHGVVTRGAVLAEQVTGGFAAVYPVLSALEERGAARRGYFVEGLGAAQFAVPGAVDRIRALADDTRGASGPIMVLAATDPANPYGAALPWPERVVDSGDGRAAATGHRAGRKAGALVVLVGGDLALYVERGGRTLLSFTDDADALAAAAKALADAVHSGALGAISVERADGEAVRSSPLRDALTAAGFRPTPRGLRLRT